MKDRRFFLTSLLAGLAAAAPAESTGSQVRELRRQVLGGALEGLEATWVEVSYAPGASSAAHKHPGPVFGFVLEGRFRFGVEGGKEGPVGPGDTFYEPLGAIHQTSANAGETPLRLAVVIIAKPGETLVQEADSVTN